MRDATVQSSSAVGHWPTVAYIFTALSLLAIVGTLLLLVTGSESLASHVAALTIGFALLQDGMAQSFGRSRASAGDASPETMRASRLGQTAALGFLFVCYLIVTWTAGDAPIVFGRDQLTAAFLITVAIILAVPPTYRICRTRP